MSNLRNAHVTLSILGVNGHYPDGFTQYLAPIAITDNYIKTDPSSVEGATNISRWLTIGKNNVLCAKLPVRPGSGTRMMNYDSWLTSRPA